MPDAAVKVNSGSFVRSLRVLLLSTDLQPGGLPLRLTRLACQMDRVRVTPIVGCLAHRGPLNDGLDAAGVENFSCDARGRFDVRCLAGLAREIRRVDPDLIHASLFHANLAARLVGRLDRSRPIITSTVTIEQERRWHRPLEAITASLSDLHVANSEAVAAHLRQDLGMPAEKIRVVPNAVDVNAIDAIAPRCRSAAGLPEDEPLIVWAGRMDPVKNVPVVIETVRQILTRRAVRLLLIGDGPDRARIAAWVVNRQMSSIVRMIGWSEDAIGWLKSANLLLLPSRTEGSPNVVLEAIACQCPVVVSEAPGCVELVRAAGIGAWCRADDIHSMAEAALRLLDASPGSRIAMEEARRRVIQRHDIGSVLDRWRRLYDDALSG